MNTIRVKNKNESNTSPQEGDIYYTDWNDKLDDRDYFIVTRCSENNFVAICLEDGCRWSNPTKNINDCVAESDGPGYKLKFWGRNVKISLEQNNE